MRAFIRSFIAVGILATLTAACQDTVGPDGTPATLTPDEYLETIAAAGTMPSFAVSRDSVISVSAPVTTLLSNGRTRVCITRRVNSRRASGPGGFLAFDPNAGVIYPGALLQGASLRQRPPQPISVLRAGGTVSINIINGNQTSYVTVDTVKASTITQAMNDIIRAAHEAGAQPAEFVMERRDVRREEQFALALGLDVDAWSNSLESKFSMRTDKQYSRILVQLTQRYFTMFFDMPTRYSDLFHDVVTPLDLAGQVGEGNPATYVHSVTYGRSFYMMIESLASQSDLEAAVSASFGLFGTKTSVSADVEHLSAFEDVRISVIALGGDDQTTIKAFGVEDLGELRTLLAEASDIRTGVPLSYVVRNVHGNSTVALQLASEYDVTDCDEYELMAPHLIYQFDAASTNVATTPYTVANQGLTHYASTWTNDAPGATGSTEATFPEDAARMKTWLAQCNGPANTKVKAMHAGWRVTGDGTPGGEPFVRFGQHRTPALSVAEHPWSADSVIHVLPWQRFDGTKLEGGDFTVIAVVRNTATAGRLKESGGQYFLFSSDTAAFHGARNTLLVGFNWEGNMEAHIRGYGGVAIPSTLRRTQWDVYAVRFSREHGLSVYAGTAATTAHRADLTLPLQTWRGASIGVLQQRHVVPVFGAGVTRDACHRYRFSGPEDAGMDIAILEIYGVAASEAEIGSRMKELRDRYQLN